MKTCIRRPSLLLLSILLTVGAGVGGAAAVTQGLLGPTSTAIMDMTVTVARAVRVTHLSDLNLGTFAGSTVQQTDTLCVFDNGDSTHYNVTIDGTNTPGHFNLKYAGSQIPYYVEYDDTGAGTNYQSVSAGMTLLNQSNAAFPDDNCLTAGSDNAGLRVTVYPADVSGSPSGTYIDTLNITIAPAP